MTANVPATATGANLPASQPPKQLPAIEVLRQTIMKMEPEFAMALPPQIPPQKFVRTLVTAVQMNQDLLDADRRSLLGSCMKAAQDGLMLDGREAALVIFRTKNGPMVQYMPMIGGLLKKLRNSGELASFAAYIAHENDSFRYELGDDERIIHQPKLDGPRGKPIAAYAIARTKDGAVYREVMSVEEIEAVRAVSRAAQNGPWVTWWGEMAKKSVSRRLMKRLPSSADIDQVLEHDNETNDLAAPAPSLVTESSLSRLRHTIGVDDAPESTGGDGDEAPKLTKSELDELT
jgi:recombination protein RecT